MPIPATSATAPAIVSRVRLETDTDAAYTMAGVTAPLEIAWYAADGKRVGGAHMAACPDRDQAHCPIYRSGRRYRLALETPGGSGIAGGLAPCG